MDLLLSLFPGIGLLDMAFEEQGFCVVRGPDLLWGGEIKMFHPPAGKFDGVIGGPPCQAHSRLVHLVRANGHRVAEDLIPEFERVVREACPHWWIMEMVPDGPVPNAATGSALVRDFDCGGQTCRTRRFSWAGMSLVLPETTRRAAPYPAVVRDAREMPVAFGAAGKPKIRRGRRGGQATHEGARLSVGDMLRRQGFPGSLLDHAPFTAEGKRSVVGNGVPLPLGREIARAVVRALEAR